MGRFIDLNKFEAEKINYIINNYTNYQNYTNEYEYFKYMGAVDTTIIKNGFGISINLENIRNEALIDFSKKFTIKEVEKELMNLQHNRPSKDPYLKLIDGPTRLEFLVSIFLVQNYPNSIVKPNYSIDDQGNPIFTAKGGVSDILVEDINSDSIVEVTLMQNKQQGINEIPATTRHLLELRKNSNKN